MSKVDTSSSPGDAVLNVVVSEKATEVSSSSVDKNVERKTPEFVVDAIEEVSVKDVEIYSVELMLSTKPDKPVGEGVISENNSVKFTCVPSSVVPNASELFGVEKSDVVKDVSAVDVGGSVVNTITVGMKGV